MAFITFRQNKIIVANSYNLVRYIEGKPLQIKGNTRQTGRPDEDKQYFVEH